MRPFRPVSLALVVVSSLTACAQSPLAPPVREPQSASQSASQPSGATASSDEALLEPSAARDDVAPAELAVAPAPLAAAPAQLAPPPSPERRVTSAAPAKKLDAKDDGRRSKSVPTATVPSVVAHEAEEARVAVQAPIEAQRPNPMIDAARDRLSTFAIDVDTASYAIARRAIESGSLPAQHGVRVEEFVNAFDYGYDGPSGSEPYRIDLASAPSPFQSNRHIVRVALQAKRVSVSERTPVHLVYLVDTSGSMSSPDKLGLAQKSLRLLTETLKPGDTVALCTYAGSVREVLPPTGIEQKSRIFGAIDDLSAGGSTAMASGIDVAYDLASRIRAPGHIRRVVVLSDGDANVGPTSHDAILRLIEDRKRQGITLSTIGFGTGNYRDQMMEQLADKGDGNYSYIDSERQARRVFQEHVSGLLQVVARDVKVQVEFDPARVKSYRLVGYENRDVADRDFRNDRVDGGEIGAGHSVTALYEVVYHPGEAGGVTVHARHKPALGGERATETRMALAPENEASSFPAAPPSLRFATVVARFADVLRGAPGTSLSELPSLAELGRAAAPRPTADQRELVGLIERASERAGNQTRVVAR